MGMVDVNKAGGEDLTESLRGLVWTLGYNYLTSYKVEFTVPDKTKRYVFFAAVAGNNHFRGVYIYENESITVLKESATTTKTAIANENGSAYIAVSNAGSTSAMYNSYGYAEI